MFVFSGQRPYYKYDMKLTPLFFSQSTHVRSCTPYCNRLGRYTLIN